jgi:hypothetical protein
MEKDREPRATRAFQLHGHGRYFQSEPSVDNYDRSSDEHQDLHDRGPLSSRVAWKLESLRVAFTILGPCSYSPTSSEESILLPRTARIQFNYSSEGYSAPFRHCGVRSAHSSHSSSHGLGVQQHGQKIYQQHRCRLQPCACAAPEFDSCLTDFSTENFVEIVMVSDSLRGIGNENKRAPGIPFWARYFPLRRKRNRGRAFSKRITSCEANPVRHVEGSMLEWSFAWLLEEGPRAAWSPIDSPVLAPNRGHACQCASFEKVMLFERAQESFCEYLEEVRTGCQS